MLDVPGAQLPSLVEEYIKEKSADTWTAHSIKNNRLELAHLLHFLDGRELSVKTLNEFKLSELKYVGAYSVRTKLQIACAFVSWLYQRGDISENWGKRITKPKLRRAKPEFRDWLFSVEKMREVIVKGTTPGKNHHVLHRKSLNEGRWALMFLWKQPVRISELLSIRRNDLNLKAKYPEFRIKQKGGSWKRLGLPLDILPELRRRADGSNDRLFKVSQERLRLYLANGCKRARIPVFTPHHFRRIAGTMMLEEGATIEGVADVMGHTPDVMWKIYKQLSPKLSSVTINTYNPAIDKSKIPIDYTVQTLNDTLVRLKKDKRFTVMDMVPSGRVIIQWEVDKVKRD